MDNLGCTYIFKLNNPVQTKLCTSNYELWIVPVVEQDLKDKAK